MDKIRIILASKSPRRKQILKNLINDFEVIPSNFQEALDMSLSPEKNVENLACQKARDIAKTNDGIIIGSDTIVVLEGEILGKPKDENDAYLTLKKLNGKMHKVITAVCLLGKDREILRSDTSYVYFNILTDDEIKEYIELYKPFDKAGAYGIQDDYHLIEKYEGSYTNIMGFPIELFEEMIENF